MATLPTRPLNPSDCWNCGAYHNAMSGPGAPPNPGDYTLCIRCGLLSVFESCGKVLKLREPTAEEFCEASTNSEVKEMRGALEIKRTEDRDRAMTEQFFLMNQGESDP